MRILVASGTAIGLLIGAAYAADTPVMRDGLWSIHSVNTMTAPGSPQPKTMEMTVSRCNKASELTALVNPPKAKDCKVTSQSSNGATRMFEMQCTLDGHTTRVKETVTKKSEDESHTITESSFDPPMSGVSGMKLVADMKYLGPCRAGMEPGDTIMSDGRVVHAPKR